MSEAVTSDKQKAGTTCQAEGMVALPEQKSFFKIPARFGHVPVAEEPLGYDRERRFGTLFSVSV